MLDFGVILIDKPPNITSFDVVRKLRKITGIRKIGHTGTLDPFATGLLQICIGKATRVVSKLTENDKTYLATCQLGIQTDTGDMTGEIIRQEEPPKITKEDLNNIIPEILKISSQIPHKFSAVKVNGKRAYELARQKKEVTLQSRPIKILGFSIENFENNKLTYKAHVSKGTYIRVLSETIAEKLGTIGTTITLRRTKIGEIDLNTAVKLEDLNSNNWKKHLVPLTQIFSLYEKIQLKPEQKELFRNGGNVQTSLNDENEVIVLDNADLCVGFGYIKEGLLNPQIVFI
ncbi:MAG: tRNA pseudouridine(55) synthase TruB [Candidatus Cloacimonadota bacterium]|nr:tRNA pseudouridine(55) synthase TruB [Candidatus Cloacimonadota bacterium]